MQKRTSADDELFIKVVNFAAKARAPIIFDSEELSACSAAFKDESLVKCCMCLIENDLNVSRTAKALYMHRNTLIYRIKKLKNETGLDVATFYGAAKFMILYRFFTEEHGYAK